MHCGAIFKLSHIHIDSHTHMKLCVYYVQQMYIHTAYSTYTQIQLTKYSLLTCEKFNLHQTFQNLSHN